MTEGGTRVYLAAYVRLASALREIRDAYQPGTPAHDEAHAALEALDDTERLLRQANAPEPEPSLPEGGRWLCISFMGRTEYTGWVTEITRHGQPAYRIDLPEKIWGGNPLAYVVHAASGWFSDRPVTEESVRKAWEAERDRQAAWEERQQRYALEGADRACRDDSDADEDDAEESRRELAEEGNATAMSDAERDAYDRESEAILDAMDEADEAAYDEEPPF